MLTAIGLTPTYAANNLDYKTAIRELRTYCLSGLCLGTTIKEASAQGALSWTELMPPNGQLNCGSAHNVAVGTLKQPDGSNILVSFSLVSTTGEVETRYRLTSINRKLPNITEVQMNQLRKTLFNRYGPMREITKDLLWFKDSSSGIFVISLQKLWPKINTQPDVAEKAKELGLSAIYKYQDEWLMSQTACTASLPKL